MGGMALRGPRAEADILMALSPVVDASGIDVLAILIVAVSCGRECGADSEACEGCLPDTGVLDARVEWTEFSLAKGGGCLL